MSSHKVSPASTPHSTITFVDCKLSRSFLPPAGLGTEQDAFSSLCHRNSTAPRTAQTPPPLSLLTVMDSEPHWTQHWASLSLCHALPCQSPEQCCTRPTTNISSISISLSGISDCQAPCTIFLFSPVTESPKPFQCFRHVKSTATPRHLLHLPCLAEHPNYFSEFPVCPIKCQVPVTPYSSNCLFKSLSIQQRFSTSGMVSQTSGICYIFLMKQLVQATEHPTVFQACSVKHQVSVTSSSPNCLFWSLNQSAGVHTFLHVRLSPVTPSWLNCIFSSLVITFQASQQLRFSFSS